MKTINSLTLKPGMKFTMPVYIDTDSMFVPANIPIGQRDLDFLEKMGITQVMTDGTVMHDDMTVEKPKPASTRQKVQTRDISIVKTDTVFYKSYQLLLERFAQVVSSQTISLELRDHIEFVASELLKRVRENANEMIGLILYGQDSREGFSSSAINCAILSATIGMHLNLTDSQIEALVRSALLHDIGMRRVSPEILDKKSELQKGELEMIRNHIKFSYEIIVRDLRYGEEIALPALEHHERWDGSGYSSGLSGNNIHILARIISIADSFEAMVRVRAYRNSMVGYEAVKSILSDNARRFDPDIVKIFIKSMGIYPIGSIILLNDGSIARVIETHTEAPVRPKVRILVDIDGTVYHGGEGKKIDLLESRQLFIAKALDMKGGPA